MDILFLLQYTCCVIMLMLVVTLVASRFQIRWPNRHFEESRWLICFSVLGLAVHYIMQMKYGFRAKSDELGALVNLLFYTPISLLVSYATFNVICFREGRGRFRLFCILSYLVLLLIFFIGYVMNGSIYIGNYIYLMSGVFTCCNIGCVGITVREIRHHRKIIEENSGEDLLPYDRYTWASYLMMGLSVIIFVAGILYRPILYVLAVPMLFSIIFFVITFIGYGFNIMPTDELLSEEEMVRLAEEESIARLVTVEETNLEVDEQAADEKEKNEAAMEKAPWELAMRTKLEQWRKDGGFRDCSLNMASLSKKLGISREELGRYLEVSLKSNFRQWLSDIRFQEAQRMLLEYPAYNNDAISAECGFSSHAHLYKIFKAKTGMTPGQWRESNSSEGGN